LTGVSTRLLLSISLVVTVVGAVDALISSEWDLLSVFAFSGLLQLSIWLQQRGNRVPMTLRPDLSHWLVRQSQESGEPVDDIVDRAVTWYQHGLYPYDRDFQP
jgi:hypothetical protein